MKPMTFLILDDEPYARQDMRDRLRCYNPDFIIYEADSIASARRVLTRVAIDVLFLDIQLMGETGFHLLEQHEITSQVVFVTAYDEFALKAFDVNARDYLLKPISQSRFEQTMSRLLSGLLSKQAPRCNISLADHLIERTASGLKVIPLKEVEFISAEDDYTRIHTISGEKHLVSRRMNEWQHILPNDTFKRVHRSFMVNFLYAGSIKKNRQGRHMIQLTGSGELVPISRNGMKTIGLKSD